MKKISFRSDILPMKDTLFRLALRITLSREEAEDAHQSMEPARLVGHHRVCRGVQPHHLP